MVIVVFRYRLRSDADRDEHERTNQQMLALVKKMPGFVSHDGYTSSDGAHLAVIRFESQATLQAWKNHPAHLNVQARARAEFYTSYQVTVATPIRAYEFEVPQGKM